jgi:hypothetical protein
LRAGLAAKSGGTEQRQPVLKKERNAINGSDSFARRDGEENNSADAAVSA